MPLPPGLVASPPQRGHNRVPDFLPHPGLLLSGLPSPEWAALCPGSPAHRASSSSVAVCLAVLESCRPCPRRSAGAPILWTCIQPPPSPPLLPGSRGRPPCADGTAVPGPCQRLSREKAAAFVSFPTALRQIIPQLGGFRPWSPSCGL